MYWLHLSKRYMWKNKARTLYSIGGVVLTFILCFSVMTAYYSIWDYTYLSNYELMPFELYFYGQQEGGASEEFIRQVKRLETYPNTEKLTVRDYRGRTVFPSRMERGEHYQLTLKLKDTSDLYGTAEALTNSTGIKFDVRSDVAQYLHQGERTEDAFTDFLVMLVASIFGLFSAAILRNTMLISVTERVRDYGLLRCVGMSKHQLRTLLFVEGMVMSLIASMLGIGLGYLGLQSITPWLRKTLQLERIFRFNFYWKAAGYSTLLCLGVTLFSLVEPSRQAGLVSPIAALQGNMGGNIGLPKILKKLKRKNAGKLWEKLFGVPGLYAYRNIKRSKGRSGSVFLAMFFSVAFLMTMLSFSDSMKAELQKSIGRYMVEYPETLSDTSGDVMLHTVGEREYELVEELEGLQDVEDATVWMESYEGTGGGLSGMSNDPYIKTLAEYGRVKTIQHIAYEKEVMEKLSPFLLEGNIDYEQMVAENGILLCDTFSTLQGVSARLTNYKVGDIITVPDIEGRARAKEAYLAAAWEVAERNGLNYMRDANGHPTEVPWDAERDAEIITQMSRGAGEDQKEFYDRILNEMLDEMSERGYDCMSVLKEPPVSMIRVLLAAQTIEYEKGAVRSYKISGIVSSDSIVGGYISSVMENAIEMIYPLDSVETAMEEVIARESGNGEDMEYSYISYLSYNMSWRAQIAVKRHYEDDLPDDELRHYAQARKLQYQDLFELVYGGDYAEDMRMLRVVEVAVWLLSVFIIIVCMIQIINTLQANMRLRRKELWLYDVVGMEPKQKFKMLLIEHGLSAIIAMITGMIASFAFSYWMLEGMLDVDGTQEFVWPVGKALLIGGLILTVILAVNMLEIRRSHRETEHI